MIYKNKTNNNVRIILNKEILNSTIKIIIIIKHSIIINTIKIKIYRINNINTNKNTNNNKINIIITNNINNSNIIIIIMNKTMNKIMNKIMKTNNTKTKSIINNYLTLNCKIKKSNKIIPLNLH